MTLLKVITETGQTSKTLPGEFVDDIINNGEDASATARFQHHGQRRWKRFLNE